MTRKSPREIERALEDIERESGDDGFGPLIGFKDPRTGELQDSDGNPLADDADVSIVINEAVVMDHEQAEAEGREIIGPFESEQNPDADLVEVYWEREAAGR